MAAKQPKTKERGLFRAADAAARSRSLLRLVLLLLPVLLPDELHHLCGAGDVRSVSLLSLADWGCGSHKARTTMKAARAT